MQIRRFCRRVINFLLEIGHVLAALSVLVTGVYFLAPHIVRFTDHALETYLGFDLALYLEPISPAVRITTSVAFGFLLFVALLLLLRNLAYRRRVRHVAEQFRECLRAHLVFVNHVNEASRSKGKNNRVYLAEKFRDHAVYMCSRISEIFEVVTQRECHTTIKSFDPATGLVKTRARDVLMHNRDRSQADEGSTKFGIEDHTAFSRILRNPQSYMFISNHLLFQSLIGRYKNKNPDWKKFYRATVVLPITDKRRASEITDASVVGFITVDSRSGRFTKRTSRLILSLFSELMFDPMVNLGWKGDDT